MSDRRYHAADVQVDVLFERDWFRLLRKLPYVLNHLERVVFDEKFVSIRPIIEDVLKVDSIVVGTSDNLNRSVCHTAIVDVCSAMFLHCPISLVMTLASSTRKQATYDKTFR